MCDLDAYIAGFKEDYFRDVEWFNSKYLLKDYLINDQITLQGFEKWEASFILKLSLKEWRYKGFMILFMEGFIIVYWL
jgi:hypothetical protein